MEYCRQRGFSQNAYYYWLRKARKAALEENGFVEISKPSPALRSRLEQDSSSAEVVGVDIKNRKNQQNVLDFLHQKPKWAGGFVPEVYVKNMTFSGKEVDVIIIKQSNNTPFYLLEDYKKINKSLFKGVIYTRKGDTNTPKTQTADLYDTELLWKRRFGLLYNPSQRVKFYLRDISNWELVEDSKSNDERISSFYYYQLDPDYTICKIIDEDLQDCEILKKIHRC